MTELIVLDSKEKNRLNELEIVIKDNIQGFFKTGFALSEIKNNKLYRENFGTFEDYCSERWDMGQNYANKNIKASEVVKNLGPIVSASESGTIVPLSVNQLNDNLSPTGEGFKVLPKNEAQARPLTKLKPELQRIAWKQAIDTAPDDKVTAAHIKKIVKVFQNNLVEEITKKATERVSREEQFTKSFRRGFQTFLDVLSDARNDGWKKTSKKAALLHLKEAERIIIES